MHCEAGLSSIQEVEIQTAFEIINIVLDVLPFDWSIQTLYKDHMREYNFPRAPYLTLSLSHIAVVLHIPRDTKFLLEPYDRKVAQVRIILDPRQLPVLFDLDLGVKEDDVSKCAGPVRRGQWSMITLSRRCRERDSAIALRLVVRSVRLLR